MTEKQGLLPSAVSAPAPRSRASSPYWATLSKVAVAALLLKVFGGAYLALDSPGYGGQEPLKARCDQAEPLSPSFSRDHLDKMAGYIDSPEFLKAAVANMAGAVQIPTESYDDMGPVGEDPRWEVLFEFAEYLKKTFPLVHSKLNLETVNTHGLVYTWKGSDSSLKPTVFMAHQDVVPVAKATIGQWTYPPFSGHYDGKYLWGRGSNDCKNNLIGILESVELLLQADYEPKRTLVLSFGFDEEISGFHGAQPLAAFLLERYGKDGAAVIVDEGAGIAEAWGTNFAIPGVAEKGYIDVEIILRMPGGHSSIPPQHNGIGVMAELITQIEANPYESRLYKENPFLGLLQCGAEYSEEFPKKLRKLLPSHAANTCARKEDKLALEAAKLGDAFKYLFTTSQAPDIISGGVKSNALPERTVVLVNHRVNVGEQTSVVKDKLTKIAHGIAKKYKLDVHAFTNSTGETPSSITLRDTGRALEPAPVTPTELFSTEGSDNATLSPYGVIAGTTRALYGKSMVVAPGIMTGNTDTKYYWDLSRHIFRWGPQFDPEEESGSGLPEGIHTVNERLNVRAHINGVKWYSSFIRNMDESRLP
ncbi:peptidase family M20/M25/M40 [Microdochium trichocladiopsis]|uniref:Peptidase family M20/M25/M40 n=1 Tax=Microdochium trichocladiopsis TaxID=1682393 RepID=A0A9P8YBY7_9PEZI|nr:peptidase family M20/M25/M40 [Microdochium trichocladiopsis]KAH7033509.1 peptidase family M20/M25/M40 [Microdochium trichocladiopsis]